MQLVVGAALVLIIGAAVVTAVKVLHASPRTVVGLANQQISVQVADTAEARRQGLSGAKNLLTNQGMLFVFDEPGAQPIWMKDMRFAIDIVWLDADKKVVHMQKDVRPDTYPQIFSSSVAALYVLELPSGFIDAHNVMLGMPAFFVR